MKKAVPLCLSICQPYIESIVAQGGLLLEDSSNWFVSLVLSCSNDTCLLNAPVALITGLEEEN
jgi:hypothetical protein